MPISSGCSPGGDAVSGRGTDAPRRSPEGNLCKPRAFHRAQPSTRRRDADMKNVMPILFALIPLAAVVSACVAG
jgi:hypothetical protein